MATGRPRPDLDLAGIDALVVALKSRTIPAEDAGAKSLAAADALRRQLTALLQDDDQVRDAELSRLLSQFARPDVRVVRMGNSMRSRLMLEHILIQVAGPDGKMSQEDGARRIARTIAERQGREARVVLLITQAETLHSKTLRLLQAMQPFFAQHGEPTLQVVFVGRQAFRALLDGRGMTPLRDALGFQPQTGVASSAAPDSVPALETASPALPMAQDVDQPASLPDLAVEADQLHEAAHSGAMPTPPLRPGEAWNDVLSVPAVRRRRSVALGFAVFAAMAFAAYMGLHAAFDREVQARAALSVPHPAGPPVAAPSVTVPPLLPVPGRAAQDPPAPPPASGPAPAEILPSDPGRSRNTPAAAPPSRVVIHVPAGSEGAEAMSAHLRAGLGSRVGTVEARRVAGTPDRPSIRYFHPGDEFAAHQIAAWVADTGLVWALQDFSTFLPRPSRGTIEVWLPRS